MNLLNTILRTLAAVFVVVLIGVTLSIYGIVKYFEKFDHCSYWYPNLPEEDKERIALKIANEISGPQRVIDLKARGINITRLEYLPYDNSEMIKEIFPECCRVYANKTDSITSEGYGWETVKYAGIENSIYHVDWWNSSSPERDRGRGIAVVRYKAKYSNGGEYETHSEFDFRECYPEKYGSNQIVEIFKSYGAWIKSLITGMPP